MTNTKKAQTNIALGRSKRMRAANADIDKSTFYSLTEAVALTQSLSKVKFDESVDLAVNLGVDPRQADQNIRVMVSLPHGTGKDVRVAVFAKGENIEKAKKAGADLAGAEDLVEQIQKGQIDFDVCIATPDMMPVIARVAKILGPKGLMPNPKTGTVTPNIEQAVKEMKAGKIECRVEKTGIIHAGVGRVSFDSKALAENIKTVIDALQKAKPASTKGTYMQKVALSSTMGPSFKLDLSSLSS